MAFSGAGALISMTVTLAFAGLVVRLLGDQRGGFVLLLQAIMSIASIVASFGLPTALISHVSESPQPDEVASSVGPVMAVTVASAAVLGVALSVAAQYIPGWARLDSQYHGDATYSTILFTIALFVGQISSINVAIFQGFHRFDLVALSTSISSIGTASLSLALLDRSRTITAVAMATLITAAIRVIVEAVIMKRSLRLVAWPRWTSHEQLGPLLRFGLTIQLGNLGALMFAYGDRLVVSSLLGVGRLPPYAIPQRFHQTILTVLTNQFQFLQPLFVRARLIGEHEVRALEKGFRWIVAVIGVLAYGGLALVGPAVLETLISRGFRAEAEVPLLLAAGQGWIHLQMLVPFMLSLAGRDGRPNSACTLGMGAAVMAALFVTTTRLGVLGASLAQLSIAPIVVLHSIWVRRTLHTGDGDRIRSLYYGPAIAILVVVMGVGWLRGGSRHTVVTEVVCAVLTMAVASVVMMALLLRQTTPEERRVFIGRLRS